MSEKEFFQIVYDGPSLENNEMDVRDLAPALIAISDLLEETNTIVYGSSTQIQVNGKGSFKTGSFKIDFSLVQDVANQLVNLFNTKECVAVGLLLGLLGINCKDGIKGLIHVLKWIRNRKIKKITKTGNGKATIEVDEESFETEEKVIDLLANIKIRQSLEVIINKPLSREGVNSFSTKYGDNIVSVDENEKEYFRAPETSDELLEDKVSEKNLQAISVSFVEGNKWKFTDGNVSFFANVKDHDFIQRVQENKESFAKDDILKVLIREKQWVSEVGIKTDYEIEKIISHRPSAKQIKLPFERGSEAGDT